MISAGLRRFDAFFGRASRNAILLFALGLAIVLGVVDYYTAPDILPLYLIPIFLAAWYGGPRPAYVVAIYCAGAAFVMETFIKGSFGFQSDASWSLIVRLLTYLFVARTMERLRTSIRQREEMSSFIVHDLRSPISSAITGLMTLEQTGENLDELEREMVTLALVSNQRALGLVNSMLDVSKLENGKMEIQRERVSLDKFVGDAFTQVMLWARSNDIQLAKDLHVYEAEFDVSLTMRVLVNLLSNALKFSPQGSTVTVRIDLQGRDGLRFAVIDQGPGIPDEFAERIFEPFAQVKGTKGGTGLGLTFCRLAINAQGGRIWVESALGKGTSMLFTLPHSHALAAEMTEPVAPPALTRERGR